MLCMSVTQKHNCETVLTPKIKHSWIKYNIIKTRSLFKQPLHLL